MTDDELREYWTPARRLFYKEVSSAGFARSKALADLLEIDYPRSGYYDELVLTGELRHKLKLLGGPYGQIIRKAMELKKNDH